MTNARCVFVFECDCGEDKTMIDVPIVAKLDSQEECRVEWANESVSEKEKKHV